MAKQDPAQNGQSSSSSSSQSSLDESDFLLTDEAVDKRHLKRIKIMQHLFAETFEPSTQEELKQQAQQELYTSHRLPENIQLQEQARQIIADLDEIDKQLQEHAPERPLSDINQVDLAILRLIVWEALHKNTPKKVLIDEAVELAKEFGSDSSPRFVNGVLGKLLIEETAD